MPRSSSTAPRVRQRSAITVSRTTTGTITTAGTIITSGTTTAIITVANMAITDAGAAIIGTTTIVGRGLTAAELRGTNLAALD
jgi:hypothetical protein